VIDLAYTLSSFVQIRQSGVQDLTRPDTFLVVDQIGYLRLPLASRWEGVADFRNGRSARELSEEFGIMWDRSISHPDLQRLHL
jgi:hypothetical protein